VLVGGYLLFDANRRATARELAASELSARLAKADLELLRWNLHPHFLFNALNTVSTLVMKGANDDAGRAISLISRYLRSGMAQRADSMVTLSEDVALVKRYLEIESLRFGDSLRIEVDADADALEATLPGSILQPLVENAIAHGTVR
jgi:LytS/YehU family sensor histidine kinase